MSVITILPSGQNISVSPISSSGIAVLTQNTTTPTTITVNQGQQGPAGVSIYVENYADNRVLTSNGEIGGIWAESDLTFDGNKLRVSGVEVSLSGHMHNLSDLIGGSASLIAAINNYFSTQASGLFSGLNPVSGNCDVKYILVQDINRITYVIDTNNFMNAISLIDGGGVLYSGC